MGQKLRIYLKGFTLIELIIVASLFSIVGLAVVSSLSSGIKIWKRVYEQDLETRVGIFFEHFSKDLRNTFGHEDINLIGSKQKIQFPGLVTFKTASGITSRATGEVSYLWNKDSRQILKVTKNLNQIVAYQK